VISMQTRNTRINEPDAFPAYINALALGITRHIVLYSVSVCCAIQMVLHPVKTMTVNTRYKCIQLHACESWLILKFAFRTV